MSTKKNLGKLVFIGLAFLLAGVIVGYYLAKTL